MLEQDDAFTDIRIDNKASKLLDESDEPNGSRQEDESCEEKQDPSKSHRLAVKNHSPEKIIGDLKKDIKNEAFYKQRPVTLISQIESSNVNEALEDNSWIKVKQEELDWFQKNNVRKLVQLLKGKHVIIAKWVFKNKLDKDGKVVRNKVRLIVKGYSQ